MTKLKDIIKNIYMLLIIFFSYIPLFTMAVFSFNKTSDKGYVSFVWNGFSWDAYKKLFSSDLMLSFVNSIIIALITSIFVVTISLLTVYSLWKQKNKYLKVLNSIGNNISILISNFQNRHISSPLLLLLLLQFQLQEQDKL